MRTRQSIDGVKLCELGKLVACGFGTGSESRQALLVLVCVCVDDIHPQLW